MKAFVGFIWTNYRDVAGQWSYELKKTDLFCWMAVNQKKQHFEHASFYNSYRDIELLQLDLETFLRHPNLLQAVDSFLYYAERERSDIFLDNEPHDL